MLESHALTKETEGHFEECGSEIQNKETLFCVYLTQAIFRQGRDRLIGYLTYCGQVGLGQYELDKIDVVGANLAPVKRSYRLHPDIQRELKWMGPMEGLPPILGELRRECQCTRGAERS
jgi:hypothetical protein